MNRSGLATALVLVACGNKPAPTADPGSGSGSAAPAAQTPLDDEAAAIGLYFDEVNTVVLASHGDCDQLDGSVVPLQAKADALAAKLTKIEAPAVKQNEVGARLKAKEDISASKLKDCSMKPHIGALLDSKGWVAVRAQISDWNDALRPPTNAAVTADRCTTAIAHAFGVDPDAVQGIDDPQKMLVGHCVKDQWDALAVTCFENIKSNPGVLTCLGALPDAPRKLVEGDIANRRAHPAEAPPEYDFTTNGFEIAAIVHKGSVPTGFGRVGVTTYIAAPKDDLLGNSLNIRVYQLPSPWKNGKPDAVFAQEKADLLKQDLKLDKDDPISLGASVGRDVQLTGTARDPELGVAIVRQRWFIHDGKLWVIGAAAMSKQKQSAQLAVQGERWVDAFAFADKKPTAPKR